MHDSSCLVKQAAEKYGDLAAIIDKSRTISFVQLNDAVSTTANKLGSHVKAGDVIGIVAPTSIEIIVLLHALWSIGAIASPVNNRIPIDTIASMLEQTGCNKVITISGTEKIDDRLRELPLGQFVDLNVRSSSRSTANLNYDRPATIVFTSGTSAIPKAACHSYANHYYNAISSNENIKLDRSDRWLLSLPLFHVGGLAILFRTLLSGAALVLPDDNSTLQDDINRHRVSHLSLVGTQLYRLLNDVKFSENLQTLKAILVGGGPISKTLLKKTLDQKLPIFLSYGMTEMTSQVTTTSLEASLDELNSSGNILNHGELKFDNSDEILVRGKKLFLGYYQSGSIVKPFDSDGWFHTGDRGLLDKNNHLHILGRIDNMFISGGENSQPEEIEKEISALVDSSQVMVVPIEDDEYGMRPVAIIDGKFDQQVLKEKLKLRLSGLKMPIAFLPWPSESESGLKVSRIAMKQYAVGKLRK